MRIKEKERAEKRGRPSKAHNTGNMPFVPLPLHKQHMCPNPLCKIFRPPLKKKEIKTGALTRKTKKNQF